MRITGPDEAVILDLALDGAPHLPPTMSMAGPTLAPEGLAGRKVVALFGRAEACDFAHVYALSARYEVAPEPSRR